jgi:hypothetical protein
MCIKIIYIMFIVNGVGGSIMDEEGIRKIHRICVVLLLITSFGQIFFINLPLVDNAQAGSIWVQDQEEDFLLGTMVGLNISGSGPDAILQLGVNESGKWTLMSPNLRPDSRRGHMVTTIYGTDKVLLFGGYNGAYYNDTWVYDVSDDTWTDMVPIGDRPSPRHSGALAPIFGTDSVILFGGSTLSGLSNETWIYSFNSNVWARFFPFPAPVAMEYHEMEMVYHDDKVMLFGGYDGTDYLDDTWLFDFSDMRWDNSSPALGPSARKGHEMATIWGTKDILLFGGNESGIIEVGDTWLYNLTTNEWTDLDPPGGKPSPRRGQGMACIFETDHVLLFGPDDQTWIYDVSDNFWALKVLNIKPSARYVTHGITTVHGDDKVVLFGGGFLNVSIENYNDTWVYDSSSFDDEGEFLSSPYDLGAEVNLQSIGWSAETPAGTTIRFQLRTATSEPDLNSEDFIGPDGTLGSHYTNPTGEPIFSGHDGDSWIQYKAYFKGSSEVSPILHEVIIHFNYIPEAPEVQPVSNEEWIDDSTPQFTWTFNDLDGLQAGFQVMIDDSEDFSSIDFDSGIQSSTLQSWQFPEGTEYAEIPDGLWYWKVRTLDNDLDWGISSQQESFKIDTQSPGSLVTTPMDNGIYKNVPTISGTASDSGSGLSHVEITLRGQDDGYYWTGSSWESSEIWLTATGLESWEFDSSNIIWNSGSQYEVQSRATDIPGNIEDGSIIHSFTIDLDAPTTTVSPLIHGAFLNKLITITGTASDIGDAGIKSVQISIMQGSDGFYWDGNEWSESIYWLSVAGKDSWSYNSRYVEWTSDSHYTISSRATDDLGNLGYSAEDVTFMFDNIDPSGLSITVNNGDTFTASREVILSLSAQDTGSGLDKMAFSSDGENWGSWEDFAVTRSYTLNPNDGIKTIHFRVMDKAGNIGESVSASITLDTSEPVPDSDNDGVPDSSDSFPEDPAASVDSDKDGYPDSWNPEKTQGHSTTGLALDEFPNDSSRHTEETKTEVEETEYNTYWFFIIPILAIILLVVFVLLMRVYRNNNGH